VRCCSRLCSERFRKWDLYRQQYEYVPFLELALLCVYDVLRDLLSLLGRGIEDPNSRFGVGIVE
jgi:hypothetical protein